MIEVVSLNPAMDRTLWVEGFAIGEVNRSFQYSVLPGGKGLNVARFLKELSPSVSVRAIGFNGGDIGRYIVDGCRTYGIEEGFVNISGTTRVCVIVADQGKSTVINEDGPTVTPEELERFWDTVSDHPELALISGSAPAGVPDRFYVDMVKKYKSQSVPVFIDSSGIPLKYAIQEGPEVIKVNEREFAQLVEADHELTLDEIAKHAKDLFAYGIQTVIVTLGSKGSLVTTREFTALVEPLQVKAVNTVACGDAYFAGYAIGYLHGLDAVDSAIYGTAASAIKAENFAPIIAHAEKMNEYRKRAVVKYLSTINSVGDQ